MDLRFTPEEVAFREEVRAFIRDNLPKDTQERMRLGYPPRKQDTVAWMRILNAKGWAAFSWPKEYGGPGWTAIQRMIFLEENLSAPAPELLSFNITMLGPVLIQFGTEAQKRRWLPAIVAGEAILALAVDEGRKHDPAQTALRAERSGNGFRLEGTKTFVADGHVADALIVAARTSGEPGDRASRRDLAGAPASRARHA